VSSRPEAAAPLDLTGGVTGPGARPAPGWLVWAALGVVYVVWGSTYLAIRVVVETVPPLLGMGLRFSLAGLLLAAVLAVRGGTSRLRVTRREAASAAVVGVFLLLGGNGMVAVA
jgi:drug/metabolite transporter (DMT)-like permease